jgi:hypothetical protein
MDTMSGAEMKTVLDGLGLTSTWFAEYVGVASRTVARWFDGADIPPRVVDILRGGTDVYAGPRQWRLRPKDLPHR